MNRAKLARSNVLNAQALEAEILRNGSLARDKASLQRQLRQAHAEAQSKLEAEGPESLTPSHVAELESAAASMEAKPSDLSVEEQQGLEAELEYQVGRVKALEAKLSEATVKHANEVAKLKNDLNAEKFWAQEREALTRRAIELLDGLPEGKREAVGNSFLALALDALARLKAKVQGYEAEWDRVYQALRTAEGKAKEGLAQGGPPPLSCLHAVAYDVTTLGDSLVKARGGSVAMATQQSGWGLSAKDVPVGETMNALVGEKKPDEIRAGSHVQYAGPGGSVGIVEGSHAGGYHVLWHYGRDVKGEPMTARSFVVAEKLQSISEKDFRAVADRKGFAEPIELDPSKDLPCVPPESIQKALAESWEKDHGKASS